MRLIINISSVFALIRFIYYPNYRNKDFLFTYFLFNLIIFIITYLLNKVELSLGAAFGLFAVFSMLRYRTEGITPKEMTYLFIVIAIGLVCAIGTAGYIELILLNSLIIVFTYALDGNQLLKKEEVKIIEYEKIQLIKPENYDKMLEDIKARTGLNVHKVVISKIDFLRDTALLKVYYYEKKTNDLHKQHQ